MKEGKYFISLIQQAFIQLFWVSDASGMQSEDDKISSPGLSE